MFMHVFTCTCSCLSWLLLFPVSSVDDEAKDQAKDASGQRGDKA